jgi:hypothetical protein
MNLKKATADKMPEKITVKYADHETNAISDQQFVQMVESTQGRAG